MIWMSPARVMFLTHKVHPPEFVIVILLTVGEQKRARCADVTQLNTNPAFKPIILPL